MTAFLCHVLGMGCPERSSLGPVQRSLGSSADLSVQWPWPGPCTNRRVRQCTDGVACLAANSTKTRWVRFIWWQLVPVNRDIAAFMLCQKTLNWVSFPTLVHTFVLGDSEGNRNTYLNLVSLTSVRVFVLGDSKANRIQAHVPVQSVLLWASENNFLKREKKAKLFQCTYQGSNVSTRLSPCLVNTDTAFSRSRNWRLLRNETPARQNPQPVIFVLVIDSVPPYPEVTLCNSHNDKVQWWTKQDPHHDLITLDLFWWWQCNVRNSLPLPRRLRPDITVMDDWVLKTIPFLSSPTLFDLSICLYLSLETTWCLSAFIHIPHKEAILIW